MSGALYIDNYFSASRLVLTGHRVEAEADYVCDLVFVEILLIDIHDLHIIDQYYGDFVPFPARIEAVRFVKNLCAQGLYVPVVHPEQVLSVVYLYFHRLGKALFRVACWLMKKQKSV